MIVCVLVFLVVESVGVLWRGVVVCVRVGKQDWKPHDGSMIFGYLADMVANIPNWVAMIVNQDELDVAPPGGSQQKREPVTSSGALMAGLDKALTAAREEMTR